jgi:BON domain-containing protein
MADYRRQFDETPRRQERDWSDRANDEVRSWFDDRGSRWEGVPDERAYGMYRSDDRDVHDRYRHERVTPHNPEDWGEQHLSRDGNGAPSRGPRERGGYWRQYEAARYEAARPHYVGRGPKNYKRSDDRIRDEICDRMTEDPALDASEIEVEVIDGEVTLSGSVMSRDQKRRAEDVAERISGVKDVTNQLRVTRNGIGHNWDADSSRAAAPGNTSSQPVSEASGKGTPSKSTSGSAT